MIKKTIECVEGQAVVLRNRLLLADNTVLTQTGTTSVTQSVFELSKQTTAATAVAGPTALTVANVVYNTLQTGDEWTDDSTGYNFATEFTPPATGGKTYRVEIQVLRSADTANPMIPIIWDVKVKGLLSA